MNFIPFIAIPIAILIVIFVAYSGFTTGKKYENRIYETMKKNNNRVIKIRAISSFREESPFSPFTSSFSSASTYKVDYVNENNENKTIFVRFEGLFSKEDTWKYL